MELEISNSFEMLVFRAYSKLRVIISFAKNMGLLIVNKMFLFISRVYTTNNTNTVCPSDMNYSGSSLRMEETTPINHHHMLIQY